MDTNTFDEAKLARMKECTNAQEVIQLLAEDGFELTDEQLEAVTGGTAAEWSLEQLIASFGDALSSFFPKDFDPSQIWSNLPMGH